MACSFCNRARGPGWQGLHEDLPAPGTFVWIRQRRWRVERVQRDRRIVRFDVTGRDGRLTFLAPFDRPTVARGRSRPVSVRPQHARARFKRLVAASFTIRTLASAVRARLDVLPYQLEPALAILNGARRVLLADEVGLGKTVQAGLVLAELLRRNPQTRALVLAPAGLGDQWVAELADRFDIRCSIADRARLDALARMGAHGDNPWRRAGVWIASLDFLKQPHVGGALPLDPWDLLILDEAHAACGQSDRHAAARELAWRARHVLLLTATPHSGDETRFSRLSGIGALDHPLDSLTVFRRTRASVSLTAPPRVSWHRVALSTAEARLLDGLRDFERATLAAAGAERRDAALLLLAVFRKRALSTATAAAVTLGRRLAWLAGTEPGPPDWTQPSLTFADDDGDDEGSDEATLFVDTGMPPARERAWLGRLLSLAEAARRDERKIERLAGMLGRATEPVIVFTEFRATLEVIVRRLSRIRAIAALHGGLAPAERREALARFRCGDATVLAATDVAGQGLNLQAAARWVVSVELPWNPARLEQRFGRVDRIGQRRPAHLTVLVARHRADDGLLLHLARRTFTARRAFGPDTLSTAAPDEAHVRAALVAGETIPAIEPARVTPCDRWRRPARAAARSIERRRRLADRQHPGPAASGSVVTDAPATHWLGIDFSLGGALAFAVPILDSNGVVLETRLVVVQAAALTCRARLSPALLQVAARTAREHLKPRMRRLARRRAARAAASAGLHAALVSRAFPQSRREAQPGLFDGRALARFDAAARAQDAARAQADRPLEALGLPIQIGPPVLRIVLRPPC